MVAQPGATTPNASGAGTTSQQPVAPAPAQESAFNSPYRQHLLALISGSIDNDGLSDGGTFNFRGELDIARLALLANLTSLQVGKDADVQRANQRSLYLGYALFASKAVLFRVLGGVDVWSQESADTTSSPALGANLRYLTHRRWYREGVDAAALVSGLPFRQLELRAGAFGQWLIFEVQFGWRFQLVDLPSRERAVINGFYVGFGTAF